ncbi:hypothetical protein EDC94DRAFT_660515 [Helicostylum pulchrum]|nr:hypothetical protein EDC94DRAFT_660515 [Helicostylum pulchrum]
MKCAASYGIEAYTKYLADPIVLVFTTNSLSLEVDSSADWYLLPVTLDPFVALGLFITQGTTSIMDMLRNDDTNKLLFRLAVEHFESVTGNESHDIDTLRQVLDERDRECDYVLQLLGNHAS